MTAPGTGSRATGASKAATRWSCCRRLRTPSKKRSRRRRLPTAHTCRALGFTASNATGGGRDSGSGTALAGRGWRPATCGLRGATSSWTGTGTATSITAGTCMPRCISIRVSTPPGAGTIGRTTPSKPISSWRRCSSARRGDITTSATIMMRAMPGSAFPRGSTSASAGAGMIQRGTTTGGGIATTRAGNRTSARPMCDAARIATPGRRGRWRSRNAAPAARPAPRLRS